MQNEPNLPKAQMNVNKVLTKDYENKPNWTLGENEPKTNPNEPNSKPISNGGRVAFEAVDVFCAGYIICPIIVLFIKFQATKRAVLCAFSAVENPFVFFV